MKVNKVVITGATSMIGVALINECITQEIECLAIIRKKSQNLHRLPRSKYLRVICCDLKEIGELKLDIIYDAIFHLGWIGTDKILRYDTDVQEENIKCSLDIVEFAKINKIKTIIGIGSQAEYGICKTIITEDTIENPQSAYGISKLASFKLSLIKSQLNNINFIWARIFSVYGDYNSKDTLIEQVIENCLDNKDVVISHANRTWNYLHSSDVATALILLAKKGKSYEIYNIANSISQSIDKYVITIKSVVGSKSNLVFNKKEDNMQGSIMVDTTKLTIDTGFEAKMLFDSGIKQLISKREERTNQ